MTQSDDKLLQQIVQAGMDTNRPSEDLRRRVLAAALSAQQEAAELGNDAAIAQDSTQPATRLVPDVPTEQADGVQRGLHPIEQPPRRRHTQWRFVTMFQKRSVRWSMAAAIAAAVVLVVGLWPGSSDHGTGNGIAWADVVQHIEHARTMVCWANASQYKVYSKDPGLHRVEEYWPGAASQPVGEQGPLVVTVDFPKGSDWFRVSWEPHTKMAYRSLIIGGRSIMNRIDVAAYLDNLSRIGSDDAYFESEATIGGMQTVVFGAPLKTMQEGLKGRIPEDINGSVRVWVSKETKMPVQFEMRYHDPDGRERMATASNIQWDVPLDDDLFQPPVFNESWTVSETRQLSFSNNRLKEYVRFQLGPSGGPVLATQDDIEHVEQGIDRRFAGIVRQQVGRDNATEIFVKWTKPASDRLREYTKAHNGGTLILDFNGELSHEMRAFGDVSVLDITPLGVTLEQFEQQYLTASSNGEP